jgi:heterodisulfide reductase subunit A
MNKKIAVYICHCGGNISDYVNVRDVQSQLKDKNQEVLIKRFEFACSDASQKEIEQDVIEENIDGVVICSCSPKLHLLTFRNALKRAGLNPYQYVHVNIREQCSWAHSDNKTGATDKARKLIAAGIERVKYAKPLNPIKVSMVNSVLVIGGGVSGMRAAIELAGMGTRVILIEKEKDLGGRILKWKSLFPNGKSGKELVDKLIKQLNENKVEIYTQTQLQKAEGCVGNFSLQFRGGQIKDTRVGAVLVCSGFDNYSPESSEFSYGKSDKIITLPDFYEQLAGEGSKQFTHLGREVKTVTFIHCAGSRQPKGERTYCSRYCCTSAVFASSQLKKQHPEVQVVHLYRDIRTYGKQEVFYNEALQNNDLFIKYSGKDLPEVTIENKDDILIHVRDLLTDKEELELNTDLLVLVTPMVPRKDDLSSILHIQKGKDGFFNEVHPKLRPVETLIDGVYISGTAQAPRNIAESVRSSLSAAARIYGMVSKDEILLDPIVVEINKQKCNGCGECVKICSYNAIDMVDGKAVINEALCKGCGACSPVCEPNAIDLVGYTDLEIESMIDSFSQSKGE